MACCRRSRQSGTQQLLLHPALDLWWYQAPHFAPAAPYDLLDGKGHTLERCVWMGWQSRHLWLEQQMVQRRSWPDLCLAPEHLSSGPAHCCTEMAKM